MKKSLKKSLLTTIPLAAFVLLSASDPQRGPSHLERIQERGKLRLICFPHQENAFVRVNLSKGPMPPVGTTENFEGIDIDIVEAFADSLGVGLEIHPVRQPSYGALIPDLLADRGDLIASSFSITEERAKRVAYSRPYFTVYRAVIVRRPSHPTTLEELREETAAIIPGSSQEEYLRSLGHERFFAVSFTLEAYTAVDERLADFAVVDSSNIPRILRELPNLTEALRLPGDDYYGIAVPPGSTLLEPLNAFLDELETSGRLATIIERHMKAGD